MAEGLSLHLPPELIDVIAERVLELLDERHPMAEHGWLRGADAIAAYIDAPRSRVYALSSAGRLPIERDGSTLIARRRDLDRFIQNGGAKRP